MWLCSSFGRCWIGRAGLTHPKLPTVSVSQWGAGSISKLFIPIRIPHGRGVAVVASSCRCWFIYHMELDTMVSPFPFVRFYTDPGAHNRDPLPHPLRWLPLPCILTVRWVQHPFRSFSFIEVCSLALGAFSACFSDEYTLVHNTAVWRRTSYYEKHTLCYETWVWEVPS